MSSVTAVALVVGCEVYFTSDGGESWRKAGFGQLDKVVCGDRATPIAIRFGGPARTGWLRTFDGWILETRDGGTFWSTSSLGHHRTTSFPLTLDGVDQALAIHPMAWP